MNLPGLAEQIGRRLTRSAIWHGDRCTWLACDADDREGARRVVAVGPELYDGAAGVALALGELAALGGEAAVRRCAGGALRQALATCDRVEPRLRGAFFTGWSGVGLAALRLGELLGEPGWLEAGAGLLDAVEAAPPPERLDLTNGEAGAILALRAAGRDPGGRAAGLAAQARADTAGFCWENAALSGAAADRPPLAGLGHGQSGPALALADEPGLLPVALGAIAWEDQRFNLRKGSWTAEERHRATWCHGDVGLLIARARLLPRAPALRPTLERAAEALAARRARDDSLCHGWAGVSEALLAASEALGAPRFAALARERWERRAGRWASGLPDRAPNPTLLLGEAGILHAILRASAPGQVPTALLPSLRP